MTHVANVTINPTHVDSNLTDFVVYIDLSDLPSSFWDLVQDGGGDIRCFKSDGTSELEREVVSCDTLLGLQFDGTDDRVSLDSTVALQSGDTVTFVVSGFVGVGGENRYFMDGDGTRPYFYVQSAGTLNWNASVISGVTLDGVAATAGATVMPVTGAQHTLVVTISASCDFDDIGSRYTSTEEWPGVMHNVVVVRSAATLHSWDMGATRTGSTITDTGTGDVDATLNNFPTDDSQWISTGTGELHVRYSGTLSATVDTVIQIHADGSSSDYAVTATYGRDNVWQDYVLVHHYNTLTDSTGNGRTPSLQGGARLTTGSGPLSGGVLRLDGSGDYALVSDAASLDFTADFTMQAWIKFDDTSKDQRIQRYDSGSKDGYSLSMTSAGTLSFRFWVNPSNSGSSTASSTATTNPVMLVGARSGGAPTLYVDAAAETAGSSLTGTINSNQHLRIGSDWGGTGNWLDGDIAEYRMLATALSADWVDAEYTNQNTPSTFYAATAVSASGDFIQSIAGHGGIAGLGGNAGRAGGIAG